MLDDLRARGLVGKERPPDGELVDILIDAYIRYPESGAAPSAA